MFFLFWYNSPVPVVNTDDKLIHQEPAVVSDRPERRAAEELLSFCFTDKQTSYRVFESGSTRELKGFPSSCNTKLFQIKVHSLCVCKSRWTTHLSSQNPEWSLNVQDVGRQPSCAGDVGHDVSSEVVNIKPEPGETTGWIPTGRGTSEHDTQPLGSETTTHLFVEITTTTITYVSVQSPCDIQSLSWWISPSFCRQRSHHPIIYLLSAWWGKNPPGAGGHYFPLLQ